ncbi:MAG: hypothetical protein DRI44_03425 [Chlamydiae bacterium]|nr:MAG: hypothetical protein DRI44_03425 [Chlamydiota bacterium]
MIERGYYYNAQRWMLASAAAAVGCGEFLQPLLLQPLPLAAENSSNLSEVGYRKNHASKYFPFNCFIRINAILEIKNKRPSKINFTIFYHFLN